MVHALTQYLPPAQRRAEVGRVLTLFAAVAIGLTAVGLGPGNAHANQTYPAALAATFGPEAAHALVARIPAPSGTHYLPRKQIERIAKAGIGKLRGLRIGPFAPGATSEALPLGQAESLIGHPAAPGANPATPAWVVTVDAPPQANILGEPTTATVFTDVIDAVSGGVVDSCAGCRSVPG
jgi:hypothetical protein